MILGHSFIVYPINIANVPWCAAIGHFIYTFHMELFFILAGYVYHCFSYKNYIKKKVERIALPYFVFGIGTVLLRAFGGAAINGTEPIGEGIIKLLFRGGGYWFLYVSFIIFVAYPILDYALRESLAIEAAFCCLTLIVDQYLEITDFLTLNTVVHYLPYFIVGKLLKKSGGVHTKTSAIVCSIGVYIFLDVYELLSNGELRAIAHFIRAVSICYVIYYVTKLVSQKIDDCKCCSWSKVLLTECSLFSLQLYLFNGYLLTVIRIIICNIMGIDNPFVIAMSIWIGDITITLTLCKYILPKIPLAAKMCGIKIGR